MIADKNIKNIEVKNAVLKEEKEGYFIDRIVPGKECIINITKTNGSMVRFVTLTEEESDYIWKGTVAGKEFVAITHASLVYDKSKITLIGDSPQADIWMFKKVVSNNKPSSRSPVTYVRHTALSLLWQGENGFVRQAAIR